MLHLHGYDIEKAGRSRHRRTMTFTARATGRFPIHVHGNAAPRPAAMPPRKRRSSMSRSIRDDVRRRGPGHQGAQLGGPGDGGALRRRIARAGARLRPALRFAAAAVALPGRHRGGRRLLVPHRGVFVRHGSRTQAIRISAWLPLRRRGSHCAACAALLKLAALSSCSSRLSWPGSFGNQDPYRNIAPTLVWIIAWVGLVYVSAFIGNVWALINPWRTLFASIDNGHFVDGSGTSRLRYPASARRLAGVPLAAGALLDRARVSQPGAAAHIASMIVAYSIFTWVGMALFGREAWLRHGEVFCGHLRAVRQVCADRGEDTRRRDLRPLRSRVPQRERRMRRLLRVHQPRRPAPVRAGACGRLAPASLRERPRRPR